jgi:hypothetical protein
MLTRHRWVAIKQLRRSGVAATALCLMVLAGCHDCFDSSCPVSHGVSVAVITTPPMPIDDVQVTLTGPATVTMVCRPENAFVLCLWPDGIAFTPGTYSLEVSAPGYRATTLETEVSVTYAACSCVAGSLQPLNATDAGGGITVALRSTDGGVD